MTKIFEVIRKPLLTEKGQILREQNIQVFEVATWASKHQIKEAAELLEPKVQHVHLSSVVLHTEKDVKQWLAGQEKTLLDRIKTGPVVIS